MKIQFKKREEFDKNFIQEGIILLYENRIEYAPSKDVDHLAKEMAKKSKLKLTDVLGNSAQLIYFKDKENIYISENRKIDLFRFASRGTQYWNLLRDTFEK